MHHNKSIVRVTFTPEFTDALYHQAKKECGCPLPCEYLVFDPSVSYASTSPFAVDKLRVISESENLKRKFLYAKETTHRMERRKFEHTAKLINDVNDKLESLRSLFLTEIAERLRSQFNATNFVHDELYNVWSKIDYLYRYQEYNIKRNFVRVRDAMAERTFGHVAIGFPALAHWIKLTLRSMTSYNVNQSCQRESVNTMIINEIDSRIEMAYQTIQNYTQLYDSFRNGTPIFRYKFGGNPRTDNWHIVPRPLLLSALNHTSAARKHSARLGKDILDFITYLEVYKEISVTVMINNTLNETYLHLNEVQFLRAGRRYYHSWSIFNSDVIDWPQTVLEQRREEVRNIWNRYSLVLNEIQDSITNLQRSLYNIRHTILDRLTEGCSQGLAYIHTVNATKLTAAETLTSPAIHEGINTMKVFFQEVRHRGQVVFDGWLKLTELATELWNRVIFDENMFEYYMHTNNIEFTQNFSVVSIDINVSYACYRETNDLRFLLGNKDRVFLKSLYDVMAEMSSYKEETRLGSAFLQYVYIRVL